MIGRSRKREEVLVSPKLTPLGVSSSHRYMELGGFIQFTLEAVGLEDLIQILSVLLVVAAKTFRTATVEQVAPITAREVWKAEYG